MFVFDHEWLVNKIKGENTMDKKDDPTGIKSGIKDKPEVVQLDMDMSTLIHVAGDLAKFQTAASAGIETALKDLVIQSRVFLKLSLDKAIESLAVKEDDPGI